MDLREEVVAFRGHYRETFNWILQAGGTRSVVLAMGDRFPLLLLAQVLVRPMKLRAAVTTEAEALASVGLHRPDLLVCSDWLESGGVVSLVREARQEVPGMGVLMLLSHQDRGLRAAEFCCSQANTPLRDSIPFRADGSRRPGLCFPPLQGQVKTPRGVGDVPWRAPSTVLNKMSSTPCGPLSRITKCVIA